MNTARVIQLPRRNAEPTTEAPASVLPPRSGDGGMLWDRGDIQGAIEVWQEVLRHDPDLPDVRTRLARAWQVLGRWEDAARELSLCLPLAPDRPDLLAQLAVCYLHSNSRPHALVLLDQALRLDRNHPLANAAFAATRTASRPPARQPESAKDFLDWPEAAVAVRQDNARVEGWFQEACAALELDERAEARVRLEELLLLVPDHYPALFELAGLEELEQRPEWAVHYYEAALQVRPQAWEAAYNLARLFIASGNETKGRALLERALLIEPRSVGATWLLAQVCATSAEESETRFWLQRTYDLDPGNAEACLMLGHIALQTGAVEEASKWMKRAYEAAPGRYESAYNLGLVRWKQGLTEEARALWWKARELNPVGPEAAQALAAIELIRGRIDEAERQAASHPTAELAFLLANSRLERGDAGAAIQHFRTAVLLKPEWRDAWINLGVLLHARGEISEARTAWSKAVALDPRLSVEYFAS